MAWLTPFPHLQTDVTLANRNRAFDDLRRLGETDSRLNHPGHGTKRPQDFS
jgi:hypothetical protein